MLAEILFVLLVLAVAVLMAVDLARTRGETSHPRADRQAHGAERTVAAPSGGPGARAFFRESVGGMPAVPAAAPPPGAGLPPREAGEAARDFGQMRREVSQSAAGEAALRGKFSAMYVNLSRRSQTLVERQLRLIEGLQHGEQDRQRLASLARLNRIAMRMHRNSQNLLLLAGQEIATRWNQPVTLAQLVEAALSEIEDYERVSFEVQPDIAVRGPAVHDVVHLLVELVDNATAFSAAEMPVHITGRILDSGGALVDIADRGIGMPAKEMAYANQQLDNPPPPDIDVPKWMGLLVVARLAARHGIRVRLNQAESGGLVALVWFPDEILTHYGAAADPGRAAEQGGAAASPAPLVSVRTSTPEMLAARRDRAWSARGAQAELQAEPPAAARLSRSGGPGAPSGDADVVMPQADRQERTYGPPIYDDVESHWTRGGREGPGPAAAGPVAAVGQAASGLPRRLPTAPASRGADPGTPRRTPNRSGVPRQGWSKPAEEATSGGQDES